MDQYLKETGKKACAEVGIHGVHGKLIDLLGRLRFRTSYGQNVLDHLIDWQFVVEGREQLRRGWPVNGGAARAPAGSP